jgi:phage-related minor tail protein
MQGGMGVMGEAGPEAIMPLTRGPDGSLGVRAQVDSGGMQGGGGNVYVEVNVVGDTGETSSSSSDPAYDQFGKELGNFVKLQYRQLMSKDLAPGGDIWKSVNNRQ